MKLKIGSYLPNWTNLFLSGNELVFYKKLKETLGFSPNDLRLYHLAFTHRSAFESRKFWKPRKDRPKKPFTLFLQNFRTTSLSAANTNERLEFLGDAVLSLLIGNILYEKYPKGDEGFLSDMRARVVNRDFFNELGREVGIEYFIRAEFPQNKGNDFEIVDSILGNAFEAMFGAIFIDKGFLQTRLVLNKILLDNNINLEEIRSNNKNYKSQILEWSQKKQIPVEFLLKDMTKIENDMIFNVEIVINGVSKGIGTGKKKKKAEQDAALQALKSMKLMD